MKDFCQNCTEVFMLCMSLYSFLFFLNFLISLYVCMPEHLQSVLTLTVIRIFFFGQKQALLLVKHYK